MKNLFALTIFVFTTNISAQAVTNEIRNLEPQFRINVNNPQCQLTTTREVDNVIELEYSFRVLKSYVKNCKKNLKRDAANVGVRSDQVDKLEMLAQSLVAACIADQPSRNGYNLFMDLTELMAVQNQCNQGMYNKISTEIIGRAKGIK